MTIDNETLLLLHAYHDGELSPGEALSMQRRIESDPELAAFARSLADLSSELTDILPGEPASGQLRGAILESLSTELVNDEAQGELARRNRFRRAATSTRTPWQSVAGLLIGLAVGGFAGGYLTELTNDVDRVLRIEDEVLAAHLRGLIAPQPFDVASSESHVVKPWFNGRTTIAPTAPDFSAQGFPLAGGRVDVINLKPVPVMVYKRRQHTISVTVTAFESAAARARDVIDGTNVTTWTDSNLTYWAVSDLNPGELSSFADLYRKRLQGGG